MVEDVDMAASTPLWVPLVVAIVGVLGTLAAAVFSQIWSRRLDEHRWKREREAEELRWKREQDERAAQWEREDRARWIADRRDNYAAALAAYDALANAVYRTSAEVSHRKRRATKDAIHELSALHNEWERKGDSLRLIAPKRVMDALWALSYSIGMQFEAIKKGALERQGFEARANHYVALLRAMQEDLGLADGTYALGSPESGRPHHPDRA
jgi:hypothetical protein